MSKPPYIEPSNTELTTSIIPDKSAFENPYKEKAPWNIPGPQPAFVEAANQVTGTILDAVCGTGENAMFFAQRGDNVTGIDFLDEPRRLCAD